MQFDLIYKEIGEYGRYQRWVVWVASSTSAYAGLLILTSFFVLAIPEHRCAIPGWDNDTYAIQGDFHAAAINRTIPPAPSGEDFLYDQCHYIKITDDGEETLEKCDRWVYDRSIFKTSLGADLNMVCDKKILKSNAQMVNFAGIFAGSFLTGIFSDKFGRKTTMCGSLTLILLCSLAMAWSPNYVVFIILTFLVGFFNVGHWMPAFVIQIEFVGPSMRRFSGYLSAFMSSFGHIGLAAIAYGIRDWSTLLIVASVPGVMYLPLWLKRVFPESPRWLFTRGRTDDAKAVINRWAKWNKVTLPDKFYEKVMVENEESGPAQGQIWHLFSSRVLCVRTFLIFTIWLVVCLGFYGLAFNIGDLGSDLYLNFMLQSLVELPANIICLLILDRVGRKPVMVGSMLIGGVALIATIFTQLYLPDKPVVTTVLALIGKMGLSAGFSTVYIFSSELFPTVVRNAGMGASSCMARIGGMVAPYVADMDRLVGGKYGVVLPQVIFGSLSIVGGIAALFLPETLNKYLPETIEQGETFGRFTDERASKLGSTGGLRQAWLSTTKKGHKLYESYRVRLAMQKREQRKSSFVHTLNRSNMLSLQSCVPCKNWTGTADESGITAETRLEATADESGITAETCLEATADESGITAETCLEATADESGITAETCLEATADKSGITAETRLEATADESGITAETRLEATAA